jgi:adenylylsulfate kinase
VYDHFRACLGPKSGRQPSEVQSEEAEEPQLNEAPSSAAVGPSDEYLQPVHLGQWPRVAWLNGTVGVGKTSVADAMGTALWMAGVAGAVIDADWLRRAWPAPAGDPFYNGMELQNLQAVADNYVQAGHPNLIVAGVIADRAALVRYRQALRVESLTVCRLRVDLQLVRERLRTRHADDPDGLAWHVHRAGELEEILDGANVEDFEVDATNMTIVETAEAILTRLRWLPWIGAKRTH